ncbi:MAG: FtsQ-type POTRA domain-containing protein [Acidimicrobiia bacterium]
MSDGNGEPGFDDSGLIGSPLTGEVSDDIQAELAAVFSPETTSAGVEPSAPTAPRRSLRERLARPSPAPASPRKSSKPAAKKPASKPAAKSPAPTSSRRVDASPSGTKRVRISDDDSGPAPSPAVGAERFRKRRISIRRAAGRRRLRWFSILGRAIVAVLVGLLLLTSPIMSIRRVEVEGNVYTNPTALGEVVADLKGEPILTADLHAAETRLERIAWVQNASVSRHLPSRVLIQIVEREPIAFYRAVDGFNRVIDRDGRVLDVIEGDPVDYPPISGTGPNLSAGDTVDQPFLGAAQLINALPADLRVRLIAMAVSPSGEISMSLTNEVEVLFGRPDNFQAKLVGVVNEIKKQGSNKYATIDVSSGEPSVR